MSTDWKPDLAKIAVQTPFSVEDWKGAWDALSPEFQTEWYWPALEGMILSFGFHPRTGAEIINKACTSLEGKTE